MFVDGFRLTDGAGVDDLVSLSDVAAMEVYPGMIIPPEYAQSFGAGSCGAIVLWTGRTRGHTRVRTDPPAPELTLDLTLSADTVMRRNVVEATLVLANRSDTTRTVCITGSYVTLVGTGGRRDVAAKVARHPCASPVELAPRGSRSWREEVTSNWQLLSR